MTTNAPATAVADVLTRAADHLAKVGHYRGDLYNPRQRAQGTPLDQCRVCLIGAIATAATGQPTGDARPGHDDWQLMYAAVTEIGSRLGHDTPLYVGDWNDQHTQDDAIRLLRTTAAALAEVAA